LEEGKIKLCDFGLTSFSVLKQNLQINVGNPAYMAPELFSQEFVERNKIDIYSFSLILWEMESQEPPWLNLKSSFEIISGVCEGRRPTLNLISSEKRNLIEKCWDQNPQRRPNFSEIVDELEKLYAQSEKTNKSSLTTVPAQTEPLVCGRQF